MLDRARGACYPRGTLKELPDEWVETAFERADEHLYCLREDFRAPVTLVQQDIREEMPSGSFDLVLCRNLVFTYFEEARQISLLDRILERIGPGGFLVVGGHESLPGGDRPLERLGSMPVYRRHR